MSRILHTSGVREWQTTVSGKAVVYRAVIILVFSLIGCSLMGQPIYFDEVYDGPSSTENTFNVLHQDDGYVFAMVSQDLFEDTGAVALIFTDYYGLEVARTEYAPASRNFNAGRFIESNDSGYVYLHSITDTIDGSRDFHLIRYDDFGEIIFTKEYVRDGDDICFWGIQCADGGYALCGQAGNLDGSSADVMLIRTDYMGNEQWRQFYGGTGWEGGADVVETSDGGFLLLGWTRSFGAGERDFYLIRTNESGNELWHETYGTSTEEIGKSILLLVDGNYLLTGSGTNAMETLSIGRLYKITPTGDVIWSETYAYENNTGNNFHKSVEAWNGDLITAGMTNLSSNAGFLVRTGSTGEVKWQREYDRDAQTDLFYDVIATDDNGFLMSGQSSNFENFTQDVWLLKVDSVGCPYPNCSVGITEQERVVLVDVWPNPATDVLNIEKVGSSERLEFSVFDPSGKEILRFTQNDKQENIDVSGWPSGVYILQGVDEKGRSFSVKVIKQ